MIRLVEAWRAAKAAYSGFAAADDAGVGSAPEPAAAGENRARLARSWLRYGEGDVHRAEPT